MSGTRCNTRLGFQALLGSVSVTNNDFANTTEGSETVTDGVFENTTDGAELSSGTLTVGKTFKITAQDGEDFTADGSPDNVVGTIFTATGTNVTLDANDKVVPVTFTDWTDTADGLAPQTGAFVNEGSAVSSDDCSSDNTGTWTDSGANISLGFDTDHYEITTDANGSVWCHSPVGPVTAGKVYRVSVDIKDGTAAGVTFNISSARQNASAYGGVPENKSVTTIGSWVTETFVINASATVSIGVYLNNIPDLGGNNIEIKNVSLYEVKTLTNKAAWDGSQSVAADIKEDEVCSLATLYKAVFTVSDFSAGFIKIRGPFNSSNNRTTNDTFTEYKVSTSDSVGDEVNIQGSNLFVGAVDDVSVKPVTIDSWISGTGWNPSTDGSTLTEGATKTAGTASDLEIDVSATAQVRYRVSWSRSAGTAGTYTPEIGGTAGTAVNSTATGTQSQDIIATNTGNLKFKADATCDVTIDNVTVQIVNIF